MNSGIPTLFVEGDGRESKCCNDYAQHDGRQEREAGKLAVHIAVHDHNDTRGRKRNGKNLLW